MLVQPDFEEPDLVNLETWYYKLVLEYSIEAVRKMEEKHKLQICSEIVDRNINFKSFFKVLVI